MFLEKTEGEKLIDLMERQAPKTSEIIGWYIDNHDTSKMDEGVRYYYNESDIIHRPMYKYENGVKVNDPEATNNKIPTNWHKTLVDQKVSYLTGNPPTIDSKNENDSSLATINEILGDDFDDVMPELVKNASNKGKDWLHPFIDEQGNFDYMIVPAQEFIPIRDNTKRQRLIGGIRHYMLDDETEKAELWDKNTVTYYEKVNGKWVEDVNYDKPTQAHFRYGNEGYGWSNDGRIAIPFVEFKNNEKGVSDLIFYKRLIDDFEKNLSDSSNTLEDVQNLIYVLKGYEGQDLDEFMTNLKRYKVIKTSDEQGAGVDTLSADIPTEATQQHFNELRDLIYQAGQGVNVSTDKFGNNPSGVALQFLYSSLDMKAKVMERKFTKSLQEFMWFVCEYIGMTDNKTLNHKDYTFTFNKSMITNEKEQVEMFASQGGQLSNDTLLHNHPWVDDVEAENDRLDSEIAREGRNLDDVSSQEGE